MNGPQARVEEPPTAMGEHPLYAFLLHHAGQDPRDLAIVQAALFHRPVLDELGVWVCECCGWCQPSGTTVDVDSEMQQVHQPVSAYAPCEQLRVLAWPYRKRFGFEARWMPEEVVPTNPPTLLGGVRE